MTTATALRFDTTEFRASHGREPRGRGVWAFRPAGSTHRADEPLFAPSGTLTEAKAWLAANHDDVRLWVVLP